MNNPLTKAQGERTVADMIILARCSTLHRIIMAGAKSAQQMFELHRRGYNRVATTATCGPPRGEYDVAFVDWRQKPIKLASATLHWLACHLTAKGALVICIDSGDPRDPRKLRSMLKKVGFHVEAGTLSHHGLTLSARRFEAMRPGIAA